MCEFGNILSHAITHATWCCSSLLLLGSIWLWSLEILELRRAYAELQVLEQPCTTEQSRRRRERYSSRLADHLLKANMLVPLRQRQQLPAAGERVSSRQGSEVLLQVAKSLDKKDMGYVRAEWRDDDALETRLRRQTRSRMSARKRET